MSLNVDKNSDVKVKKGPGRPRKIPKKEIIPRHGIINEPSNKNNIVEFSYDDPLLLKKTLGYFKALASAQLQVIFSKENIIFYAQDHHNKSRVRIKIDGNKANSYYCKDEIDTGLNCKDLELILNKIDKEYSDIKIIITKKNQQKYISIMLNNNIQIIENHNVDVITQYNTLTSYIDAFNKVNHTLNFTLPGKYFKKTINDMKSFSNILSIQQEECNLPVTFEYMSKNKKIKAVHTIKDNKKINLVSKLEKDDMFRVDVRLEFIKPISSINISDNINISVDENSQFMTTTYLDNKTIEIKTLTEILDMRQ